MALGSTDKGGPSKKPSKDSAGASAAEPVLVYKLLEERLILTFPDATSKEEVVRQLGRALGEAKGLPDPEGSLKKVLEREAGISTTLDTGLAIPHARLAGLKGLVGALGLLPKGLPDQQQPDITIKIVLLFFSPDDPAFFQRHLQFLRHVSTLFQPALIDQLLESQTPREVLAVLRAKES